MKIAFLNIFQDEVKRGLETYTEELSKRLAGSHKVEVFSGKSKPLTRWPILWRFYLDPHGIKIGLYTLKLLPKIWKEKYDFVFPLNGGWQPALVRFITWLYGGKVIIPGQSGRGWDERNNLWCFPDAFVALSEEGKRWARSANPFVRVEKIPNGVDTDKFNPKGPKYKVDLRGPVVICQGAAEPSKRLHLAVLAVSKLKDVSLLIVGSGSLKKEIFKLGEEYLGKRFQMLQVLHSKMPDIYRAGDLFTLPSQNTEAFGISNIEALATNLPVVATDDEIRREIIGDAGLFVDPEDVPSYSKAIQTALRKNWGDKPKLQAKKFDWNEIANAYEDLLSKLVNG